MPNISEKCEEFINAMLDGRIGFLANLARQYGQIPDDFEISSSELKFYWASRGLEIFVNDQKFFLIVRYRGRIVCSTKSLIFAAGDWWGIVAPYRPRIEEIMMVKRIDKFKAQFTENCQN